MTSSQPRRTGNQTEDAESQGGQRAKTLDREMGGTRRRSKHLERYHQAELGLRNYWYPAVLSRQLKYKKPVGLTMLGEEIVFVRDEDSKVYGLQGRCLHRGIPLSEGRFEFPCTISCPYHGWTYNLETGALVAALTDGPESKIVGKAKLRTYPIQERKGLIWVFIGDDEPPLLEDDVPFEFLDSRLSYGARVRTFRGNWRLAMENALDSSHAFYLHRPAWIMAFTQVQAYKGKYWVEISDDRYVGYKTEVPYYEAAYPGLGKWPPRKWWRARTRHIVKYTGSLPCAAQVQGVIRGKTVYSWFVPVDKDHYRWFQFLGVHGGRLRKAWFQIQYYLVWRWLYQGQFLGQDSWINDIMHPYYAEQGGWDKERLYRPDVVITAWRKFLGEKARGFQGVPSGCGTDTSSSSSSSLS